MRWTYFFTCVCNVSSCLQQCKNYENRVCFSSIMITNVLPRFFRFTVYNVMGLAVGGGGMCVMSIILPYLIWLCLSYLILCFLVWLSCKMYFTICLRLNLYSFGDAACTLEKNILFFKLIHHPCNLLLIHSWDDVHGDQKKDWVKHT